MYYFFPLVLYILNLLPCITHFYDIPIVDDHKYSSNFTRIYDNSTGYSYNPLGPLVYCSYLPRHSIWCEPPLVPNTMGETDFCILDDDTTFMNKYPDGVPLAELIPFYESVSRNEPIRLQWVCPGKIDPKARNEENRDESAEQSNAKSTTTPDSSLLDPKAKEFDFDESVNQPQLPLLSSVPAGTLAQTGLPLRRIVGTPRHPPRQARVASMDKILNDLFKTRKAPVVSSNPADTSSVTTVSNSNFTESPRLLSGQNEPSESTSKTTTPEHQPDETSRTDTPSQPSESVTKVSQQELLVALSETSLGSPPPTTSTVGNNSQMNLVDNTMELGNPVVNDDNPIAEPNLGLSDLEIKQNELQFTGIEEQTNVANDSAVPEFPLTIPGAPIMTSPLGSDNLADLMTVMDSNPNTDLPNPNPDTVQYNMDVQL